MKNYLTLAMTSAAIAHEENLQFGKTCTALVLSGGGVNGAWEAGVIWGLLHYGNPKDYKYDVLSGVSAGSINSAGLSGFKIGQELAFSEWLSNVWDTIQADDIFKDWKGGIAHGLFEPGIYDDSPALAFM